jgi:hypothetical protein
MALRAWAGSELARRPPRLRVILGTPGPLLFGTVVAPRWSLVGRVGPVRLDWQTAKRVTSRGEPAPEASVRRGRHLLDEQPFEDKQLAGINALLSLASTAVAVRTVPTSSQAPSTSPRALTLLKDPALRGAFALMLSAVMAGGLGFAFWSLIAHRQDASAVGSVTAEVSSITSLAGVGSLNLINVFARFMPQAGWDARRLILTSYGGAALAGMLAATVFLLTPWAAGLVLGGDLGRLAFAVCVVLTSVFMIQDGGLVGFGRSGWVPVENILVASARLALLPLGAMFLSAPIGVLWSWAVPMAVAVVVVNVLLIGRLAGQQTEQPSLPTFGELGRFVAIESVTTAVSTAVSTFLPALVTQRLGASKGGYFYVPWIIATMVSLLLCNILISMVREAVANPAKADLTIRRSIGLALLVVTGAMIVCLLLPRLVLAPLGADFAAYGAPLLRWVGLALPATALNLLYWATCLVRRHPWPVLAVNLTTSGAVVGGVMLLGPASEISRVGMIYCIVQWGIAVAVSIPTIKALRVVRQREESR